MGQINSLNPNLSARAKPSSPLDEIQDENQKQMAKNLQLKMTSLGFLAPYTRLEVGPVVSNYYFKPLPTSPLSKIMGKSEDLSLAIGSSDPVLIQRIRDEISISVPNKVRNIVQFDNCLFNMAKMVERNKFQLPLLMGQDSVGNYTSLDLSVQPHILIAGATGGGKSVFLSELICSLAVTKSPDEVKFVLVDTKQLDLVLFSNLTHVIEMVDKVDPNLYDVLELLIAEVRKRTEIMKGKARNLAEWNKDHPDSKLPYIVLVIDELADVIGQDKEINKSKDKDTKRTSVSTSLATLAQISRAAGVHIIAATQRPSVKIINGDIKANFPTRISFKLPSQFDSRVILDESGAENLLGKGDYLFKTADNPNLQRGHGAFVSMDTIDTIIGQHEQIRRSFECLR